MWAQFCGGEMRLIFVWLLCQGEWHLTKFSSPKFFGDFSCSNVLAVNGLEASWIERSMDRPLVIGSASGVFSSLALAILRDFSGSFEPKLEHLGNCLEALQPEEDKVWWFLAGLAVGVSVWPLVDLLWLLREKWRRYIWRQLGSQVVSGGNSRPCYKIIAWVWVAVRSGFERRLWNSERSCVGWHCGLTDRLTLSASSVLSVRLDHWFRAMCTGQRIRVCGVRRAPVWLRLREVQRLLELQRLRERKRLEGLRIKKEEVARWVATLLWPVLLPAPKVRSPATTAGNIVRKWPGRLGYSLPGPWRARGEEALGERGSANFNPNTTSLWGTTLGEWPHNLWGSTRTSRPSEESVAEEVPGETPYLWEYRVCVKEESQSKLLALTGPHKSLNEWWRLTSGFWPARGWRSRGVSSGGEGPPRFCCCESWRKWGP